MIKKTQSTNHVIEELSLFLARKTKSQAQSCIQNDQYKATIKSHDQENPELNPKLHSKGPYKMMLIAIFLSPTVL